jgi:ligand-binding sensor domain-containing protein
MRLKKGIFILVFLNLIGAVARAQSPFMWHLTDAEGLPSMEVYSMLQDKKGFMWLGTDNGPCRYDGKRFTTFFHPAQRGKAFSYFKEDPRGRIWFLNFSGQIFFIDNDSMHLFEPFEQEFKTSFPMIEFDSKGNLWVASIGNPLMCYTETPAGWVKSRTVNAGVSNSNMAIDEKDNLMIVDYSIGTRKISPDGHISARISEPDYFGYIKYAKELGSFISFRRESPAIYNFTRNQHLSFSLADQLGRGNYYINDVFVIDSTDIWITTYNGLFVYRMKQGVYHEQLCILPDQSISGVLKDREGNYWISTLKDGVYILPSLHIWSASKSNSTLADNRIYRMAKSKDGKLFLALGNGTIAVFDAVSKKFIRQIDINVKKDIEEVRINPATDELYISCIKTLIYDLKTNRLSDPGYEHSAVKRYDFDERGNIFLATSFGGYLLEHKGQLPNSIWSKMYPRGLTKIFQHNMVAFNNQRTYTCTFAPADTTIWFGTTSGLKYYRYNKEYQLKLNSGAQIYVTDMEQSANGTIWVGTVQQGIIAIRNRQVVKHLTVKQGLRSNYVRTLTLSGNTIWFAGERGVQSYDISTDKISTFSMDDGLLTRDILDIAEHRGTVYLATSKGFQWFNVDELRPNSVRPLIYLTGFNIQEKDTVLKEGFVIPYNQNNIMFRFNGFSFRSGKSLRYNYRLLGLDTSWVKAEAEVTFARYPSLPPGEYIFEVKAVNADGYESEHPATISFTVQKPYWQQWWFYLLLLMSISSLISFVFLLRIRSIRRRNEDERIKAELALEKSRVEQDLRSSQLVSLKAQMNPHFVFNALNSIQEYIMLNEKKLANSYLGKFADLMRMTLDISSKQQITLSDEIRLLQLYLELEVLRFEDKLSYTIDIETGLNLQAIHLPPMLIQPYVENAIKHGLLHVKKNRKLLVKFEMPQSHFLLATIEDNGIGRKRSEEIKRFRRQTHKSFATSATQKRLELLNYQRPHEIAVRYIDLYNEEGKAAGTRVELTIPVNDDDDPVS